MRVGLSLHPGRGVDAVFEEARLADRQGFETVWLSDHLSKLEIPGASYDPYENFTLMTAIGAITSRTRLAWAMLNTSFRRPVVLAKMLSTLDHITKGRVICSVGSGWFKDEYAAYDIPLIDDHDARANYGREVVRLMREVWTHPAPERVDFDGEFVHVADLRFEPAPYQKPHPPIWIGGDSAATLASVKELADGWVTITSGTPDGISAVISQPDWPNRPMDLVKNARIHVGKTRDLAIEEARVAFDSGALTSHKTLEEYIEGEVVGSPDECLTRLKEIESWGITQVITNCVDLDHQERIATMILPEFKD